MKKMSMLLAAFMAVLAVVPLGGCAKKIANDENTLEIYIGNFGYGYEWLDDVIAAFKEEDWVKETYPNLNIPTPQHNSQDTYGNDRILSGAQANSTDLFFVTKSSNAGVASSYNDGSKLFEELTDVLDSQVPGESKTLREKINPSVLESEMIEVEKGKQSLYGMPWVNGLIGLLYNESAIERALGRDFVEPRTTDELLSLSEELYQTQKNKSSSERVAVFSFASGIMYWDSVLYDWWAQYEGIESYNNFYKGIVVDRGQTKLSADVYKQQGRLEALKVLDSLIGDGENPYHKNDDNQVVSTGRAYNATGVNTDSFTTVQAKFMQGKAFMAPNGDWFGNEMKNVAAGATDVIKFMKTPVISSLAKKCTTVATEENLRTLISAIDGNKTYEQVKAEPDLSGLSEKDYKAVYEARHVFTRVGGHNAYIPSYATAKNIAKDFLRFMATDKAIVCFMKATGGSASPFIYNGDVTQVVELSPLQLTRRAITEDGLSLRHGTSFPLTYFGGMQVFPLTRAVEVVYTSQNEKDRKSAQTIYDESYTFMTENNGRNWDAILTLAGVK